MGTAKRHIVVAVPAYGGTVHMGFMRSLIADVVGIMRRGDVFSLLDQCGGAEIDTVRAQIVAEFMAGTGTHLVMVDSDLCWSAGGIMRLVDHDKEFAAGLYPHRQDPITWPVHLKPGTQTLVDGLLEVEAVPGGFICLKREALDRMIAEFGHLRFTSSKTDRPIWALFDHVWRGNMRLSEDLSFCDRWRSIGGRIWADPGIKIGHIGPKLFAGTFGEAT